MVDRKILEKILGKFGDGVVLADRQGKLLLQNPAAERILGPVVSKTRPWERAEGCGFFLPDRVTPFPPEDFPLARAIRGEDVEGVEVFVRNPARPEGLLLSMTAWPLEDSKGELDGGMAVLREVTERNREDEARASEERFRTVADRVPAMLWMAGPDALCTYCNTSWLKFCGRSFEEEMNTGWSQHIHPEDRERTLTRYLVALDARAPVELEYRMRRHDGSYRWLLDQGAPFFQTDGSFAGYVGSCIDITERKLSAEALRESEIRFRKLADRAPVGIFLTDPEGRCQFVNSRWCEIAGLTPEETTGGDWTCALHPEDRERIAREWQASVSLRGEFASEYRFRTPDGKVTWLSGSAVALKDDLGATTGYLGTVTEITERKESESQLKRAKEAAESANIAKSEFLANMSHEIRTPMTAIIGYADLVLDGGQLTQEQTTNLQIIRHNGKHLLTILNDILDLSKLDAGKMTVERIPCQPSELLSDVVSLLQVRAREKDLELGVEYLGLVPETIQTDPTRLRQILLNLVGNSIKFTQKGGVRILTSCLELPERESPLIFFEILDTGIGMTGEQKGRLFQKFSQGDTSTERKFGGTGLGLVISKRFANLLGGNILVQSSPGEGSSFMVWVETGSLAGVRMLDKPGRIHFVDASLSPSGKSIEVQLSGRVLLADDVAVTRKLVSMFLEKAEAKVETAENGRIALEKGKEAMSSGKPFDLILMDMQMPEMDGYTATTELRKAGFKGPVVALTASAMVSDREKCIRAGCDEFITKPVDRKKLLELADRFMKQGSAKVQPGGSGGGSSPAPEKDDGMEERLVSEMASDPEMAEIIQMFLEWLPGRIEVLEGMKNAASLGSKASGLAHEIKGAAGSSGFKPIQDAAEELEGRIRGKADPRAVAESLEKLIEISKRACLDPARAP